MQSQISVARGATSLYVANVVVLLANTFYFLLLTNVLRTTQDVGIVTALNIMIILLVTICILGQPITIQSPIPAPLAVLKFLPEFIAKNALGQAAKLFRISISLTGILGGTIGAILIAFPTYVAPLLGGQSVVPVFVQLSAVDVVMLSLAQICLGSLIALDDMRRASAYMIVWSVARYTIASLLLFRYAIVGVLSGFIVGDAILLILSLWASIRAIRMNSGRSSDSMMSMWKYSLYTLFSALMGFGISQADKIFALAKQGLPELAVYNVAIVAASFTGFAPYALLTVLLPALSALHASDRTVELHNMVRAYSRYVAIVVIPIALGFASVSAVALRIFGLQYLSGFLPTVIVSVATGLTAIGSVYAAALLALSEVRWYAVANIAGLLALLLVSALFTPIVSLNGPALGRASLLAVTNFLYAFAIKRRGFFELDVRALLSATGGSALMGATVFLMVSQIHSFYRQLALLPVLVILGAAIYIGSLRSLGLLTPNDLDFVLGMTPLRFHWLLRKLAKLSGVHERRH